MTFRFLPTFPKTLARRPFLWKILLSFLSLMGLGLLYALLLIVSRLVGLPEDSPLSVGLSTVFAIAAIVLMFGVFLYVIGVSGSRCRSLGISEWWCLIYFMPYVNLLFFLYLACWPPRADTPPAVNDAPAGALPEVGVATSAPALPATSPTMDPGAAPAPTESSWKTHIRAIVGIVVIMGSLVVGRLVSTALTSTGNGTASERAQTLLSSKEAKEYVSTEHGFRAVFPGFPEIERDTIDVAGYAVPYTFYMASLNPDTDARAVFIYDYSVATDNPADIDLEGALNGMVQNSEGGQLVSTAVTSLGGVEGIEGSYRSSLGGQTVGSYARLAKRGTKLYVAWSTGIPKAEFDAFAGSFRFE